MVVVEYKNKTEYELTRKKDESNIVRDLYGKKEDNPSDEETFEIDFADEQEEMSVSVAESDTGFSIGDETFETNIIPEDRGEDKASEADREKQVQAEFERKKAQVESLMEETRPCFSDAYDQENLRMTLINKGISGNRPALKWTSSIDHL